MIEVNKKIMIVEDEALIALSLQTKLVKLGYDVPVVVHTGEEAVEEAARCNPDLILMDINLVGSMSGTTAAAKIRSKQQVPVIFLTAYSDDTTLQEAKESNPFGYILKPYKDRELRGAIEVALHKHKKEQEELKTIAAENDKLVQLNLWLHERNDNKDKMFSIISHDLRGNAWRIDSLMDILMTSPEYGQFPAEAKPILDMVKENTKRNKYLVDDLLVWARNQFDAIEYSPVLVLLKEIVDQVESQVHNHVEAKHMSIKKQIPEDLEFLADKNMLIIILRNLVSNAIKFSNPGDEISIKAYRQNNSVIIEVADRGIGISQENLGKLFDKNVAFSTYGTKGEKGTGFGLELCADFVERHNGKIEVESELNKGSTFKVVLPFNME